MRLVRARGLTAAQVQLWVVLCGSGVAAEERGQRCTSWQYQGGERAWPSGSAANGDEGTGQ